MTGIISFFVEGRPAPQGSKRYVGRGRMVESSRHLKPWRHDIRNEAEANQMAFAGCDLAYDGPVRLRLEFVMLRPKATPKTRTPPAVKRPDLDKLTRAVFDGITGTLITDDSQVVDLQATKRIANIDEPCGVHITLRIEPTP
ncbi:RusA family crossover junction endodeoxyribonuclease [Rhodococcus erythropolis]|uniref:RusA family crossover junction endodeoxyribonuclease n=1 Tax=Rhodococcus erythropolis TaxID=1833 RepID=UPI002949D82B|nr:RusA family crossover junction endodeoxyribonuclease [Rhodococcus erythropolis]MDV6276393.1 RusA family crossover junction endodeoxyribonuclease [Rhodococcus erythropolis]